MSSFGDSGTGLSGFNTLGPDLLFRGICRDRPRPVSEGRWDGAVVDPKDKSSLEEDLTGSRNLGDGESIGGVSDNDRTFGVPILVLMSDTGWTSSAPSTIAAKHIA